MVGCGRVWSDGWMIRLVGLETRGDALAARGAWLVLLVVDASPSHQVHPLRPDEVAIVQVDVIEWPGWGQCHYGEDSHSLGCPVCADAPQASHA